jgi:hypothetical protein
MVGFTVETENVSRECGLAIMKMIVATIVTKIQTIVPSILVVPANLDVIMAGVSSNLGNATMKTIAKTAQTSLIVTIHLVPKESLRVETISVSPCRRFVTV